MIFSALVFLNGRGARSTFEFLQNSHLSLFKRAVHRLSGKEIAWRFKLILTPLSRASTR